MIRVPREIQSDVDNVCAATQSLIAAAQAQDAEAIQASIEHRAKAVSQLCDALNAGPVKIDPAVKAELIRILSVQADDATSALRSMQSTVRDQLAQLSQGGQVSRGYAAKFRDPSALDRSG